jgi:hypothetical protein
MLTRVERLSRQVHPDTKLLCSVTCQTHPDTKLLCSVTCQTHPDTEMLFSVMCMNVTRMMLRSGGTTRWFWSRSS